MTFDRQIVTDGGIKKMVEASAAGRRVEHAQLAAYRSTAISRSGTAVGPDGSAYGSIHPGAESHNNMSGASLGSRIGATALVPGPDSRSGAPTDMVVGFLRDDFHQQQDGLDSAANSRPPRTGLYRSAVVGAGSTRVVGKGSHTGKAGSGPDEGGVDGQASVGASQAMHYRTSNTTAQAMIGGQKFARACCCKSRDQPGQGHHLRGCVNYNQIKFDPAVGTRPLLISSSRAKAKGELYSSGPGAQGAGRRQRFEHRQFISRVANHKSKNQALVKLRGNRTGLYHVAGDYGLGAARPSDQFQSDGGLDSLGFDKGDTLTFTNTEEELLQLEAGVIFSDKEGQAEIRSHQERRKKIEANQKHRGSTKGKGARRLRSAATNSRPTKSRGKVRKASSRGTGTKTSITSRQ